MAEANDLHDDPLSTISAIWPKVTQGHQHVMQPRQTSKKHMGRHTARRRSKTVFLPELWGHERAERNRERERRDSQFLRSERHSHSPEDHSIWSRSSYVCGAEVTRDAFCEWWSECSSLSTSTGVPVTGGGGDEKPLHLSSWAVSAADEESMALPTF